MKLLKLIFFICLIYFIRRFIQMFKVMKRIQEAQRQGHTQQEFKAQMQKGHVVEADFKVVD